jgi:TolB protein
MRNLIMIITLSGICAVCIVVDIMSGARRLTDDPAQEGFPTWAPDGQSVVYQYTDMNDTLGKNGLWRVSPDGTGAEHIFSGFAEHPRWSPDGRHIVFDADTGRSIRMIPADGGSAVSFLPDTLAVNNGGLPCWSPDASQIAFKDSGSALCIYDMHTGKTARIFSRKGMSLLPGCWSVDGRYILAALMDRQSGRSTIWKVSSDGREALQVPGHHENFYRYLTLSPDGSLLVYGVFENKYLGLYIMPAEGGVSLPLAVTRRAHNEGPAWSPDGKKIAFTSTRSGNHDVWVMNVDTKKIRKKLQRQKK